MLRLAALFALFLTGTTTAQPRPTVAETSGYTATSRFADVVNFCAELARRSPAVRVETFGTTTEGRKLPLLVIADPPVKSAAEARASGKLVVLAFANIHAGEVDGKEALLALARDLSAEKGHVLLKDLVVLLVPILNADGNERFDPKNRPEQNGPPAVGIRENAQGLDLNRDFVKLESPEVRALVKLLNVWDPALVIDCHTTNGSKHRHTLTYDGPRYPLGDARLADWANERLFPDVAKRMKAATGFDIAPYGNFSKDRTRWETYPASPRFGVQYFAARGRVGILSESYSHATFQDRVKASYAFVKACFEATAANRHLLRPIITGSERMKAVPVRTKTTARPRKLTILGFEEVNRDGQRVATDKPKDYKLDFVASVEPEQSLVRPDAYLVPANHAEVIHTLQRHGVKVEELREDIVLDVEAYQVLAVDTMARPFQKHQLMRAEVRSRSGPRRIAAGTMVVKTGQPLGDLAAYLLEPAAEDGFVTWSFFADDLAPGRDYPVLRLPKLVPLTTGPAQPPPEERVTGKRITEEVLFGPNGLTFGFAGNAVAGINWLPDGEHFLQSKGGKFLKVDARTGKSAPFIDSELLKKSLLALKDVSAAEATRISNGTFFRMDPKRVGTLVDLGQDLGYAYFDGRPAVRLTKLEGRKEHVTFAPDGKRIAFVRGGNVYAVEIEKPELKQLTTDGGKDVFNGRGDWVYEEEIFNRSGRAFWWSPDSKQIAFMRFDDAPVKRFPLLNLQPAYGQLELQAYPKAGEPNPTVRLGVIPAAGGTPVFLDLDAYPAASTIVCRLGWLPDSRGVFAYVQDRAQTWLDFVVWPAPGAKPRRVLRDTTRAWIEDPGAPHFLPDGSVLFPSERTGWKHLYHHAADGRVLAPVTDGEWEVKDVLRVDAADGLVYFTGTRDGHLRPQLYRAKLDGSPPERLTTPGSTHHVDLAPTGLLFIDRFSDPMTPSQVVVNEAGKGKVRTLDTNPVRERDEFKFGKYERVQIPTADGFRLEAAITYPPGFDPKKKYPVWMLVYGGPRMPSVSDEFRGGRVLEQTLASSGIIAFRVDPRSASGKGAVSAWACYKQLGVQELKDLEEAVGWLCKNPWADSTRVGISGHSYGGFMAAFALTHGKAFSAGIASGPVTDWRLYDSIYTERYMMTPKDNPDGYDRTSCVKAAGRLTGKLLIIHGMIDDNVHLQNSVQLVDALQRQRKSFEMMFYPQSRHGIGSQHYLRLQLDFIRRSMGVKGDN